MAVDAEGGGNWRTLSITPGTLPFVPSDVTLQSVKIKDGVVALHGPKGIGVAELDGLNGEFKADSIEGPFSFKGTAQWQGADRELRFATDVADAEGAIRFKATVHGTKRENAYNIDGRLLDLRGHPRVEGDVTAKLDLDASAPAQPQAGAAAAGGRDSGVAARRLQVELCGRRQGIAARRHHAVVRARRPAAAHYRHRVGLVVGRFERRAQSRVRAGSISIASPGRGAPESPFDIARSFVSTIMQSLPMKADTKVRFNLDQANLGGEAVSGVRVEVARANGTLLLKELRAGLPGGSKLALYGTVADTADARAFQGELALRGTSLARFLKWAAKDGGFADDVRTDGPFALQGRLGMSAQAVDLVDAGGEIGGEPLTGEVHYRGGERTRARRRARGPGDRRRPAVAGGGRLPQGRARRAATRPAPRRMRLPKAHIRTGSMRRRPI